MPWRPPRPDGRRPGRGRRALAAGAALAVALGALAGCGDGEDVARAEQPAGLREPDEVREGCGRAARTDPAELSAGRTVARCATGAPEPQPLPAPARLRVAVPPERGEELAPVLLAHARGEFAAEGLDVDLVDLPTDEAMAALTAGGVDVVVGPLHGPFFDAAGTAGARQVLGGVVARAPGDTGTGQPGLWVRTDAVTSGEDLALQAVALPAGLASAATYPLRRVVDPAEKTLSEVDIVDAGGAEAAQRLLDGQVVGAWLDDGAWSSVADAGGHRLLATLPAAESIDGTVVAARLLAADRPVGLAYVRAVVRTINTHLSGDYHEDDEVVAALADATGRDAGDLAATPPLLFDWEIRQGTAARVQAALIEVGGTASDAPIAEERLVDRTLASDVVAGDPPDVDPAAADGSDGGSGEPAAD